MATKFDNTLQMTVSTDTLFRAWVQFLDDLFIVAGGWTHTADTGQMTIATATHPSTINVKVGYRIYAMADALQATAPIFIKVEYGSGSSSTTEPAIYMTFGTGSDGAGTITNVLLSQRVFRPGTAVTTASNSYGSADTNRIQFSLFADSTRQLIGSVERTKDATGADTGDGILVTYCDGTGSAGAIRETQYLVRAGGSQPSSDVGASFIISNHAVSAFSSDVGVGLLNYFKGISFIGLGIVVVNSSDFASAATFTISLYGNTVTYQLTPPTSAIYIQTGNGAATLRASTCVGVRYE
jgi:hypothetical protein